MTIFHVSWSTCPIPLQVYEQAMSAGLEVHMITDSGKTEFHGQPTRTCLAIGPAAADRIDAITGHLELL